MTKAPAPQKRCSRCGTVKSLDEFYKNKAAPDGHQWHCKVCMRRCADEWAVKHREHVNALSRERARKNPGKKAAACRRWEQANPDKVRKKKREWNARNRAQRNAYDRQASAELRDFYVARQLGSTVTAAPPALIELKREQLTVRRLARQLRKAKDESSKDPR